ncbi:UTP--hexose-1-phosphate uridylyltransferase [Mitsuokella sp. oral taxon 131 str. W9106]|nr:UTP--hexose-1-phosphate uridylyltransferase [Mitsuokella sp. oral taxon 131 str. W9106]
MKGTNIMVDIQHEIARLLNFAEQELLITPEDVVYSANRLLDVLAVESYRPEKIKETLETPTPILLNMLDYAAGKGLIENTANERDRFDTRIMDCVMPRPSEVVHRFWSLYRNSPKEATDGYYRMNIASNYIRKARIDKNIAWKTATEYGDLDVTINLSKPEKDPRDIAKAKRMKSSAYPKCLLCRENEGYAGRVNYPARETHRLIPLDFGGHEWFLQYSPYTYYNEHCIILNGEHIPMKISRETFENLITFLRFFPHYFAGSNADLPIVGGSILSHDHYQGGRCTFAMERASVEKAYAFADFPAVKAGRVKWPMSALRLTSEDPKQLVALAEKILAAWRTYSDASAEVLAETDGTPHNTITPIARKRGSAFEFDLVLRNNRTTAEHPLGLFHPHAEVHHIKKENIGLIEVLGLAILPARLKDEMLQVRAELLKGTEDISGIEAIAKHADWYKKVKESHADISALSVGGILKDEIGHVFLEVLTHAGVFKRDAAGMAAFDRFIGAVQ